MQRGRFFARDGKGFHREHAGIGSRENFACALEAWSALRVSSLDQVSVSLCALHFAMAPHLTSAELDFVFGLRPQGKSPAEVHAALSRKRSRHGLQAPTLKRLRGALRGITYRRSRTETRGGVDLGRGVRVQVASADRGVSFHAAHAARSDEGCLGSSGVTRFAAPCQKRRAQSVECGAECAFRRNVKKRGTFVGDVGDV